MQVGRQMWAIGRFFMWQNDASHKTQPCLRSYIHQLAGDRTGMEEREAEAVRHTGRFVESITTATPVLAPQNTATARTEPPRRRRRRATEETAAQNGRRETARRRPIAGSASCLLGPARLREDAPSAQSSRPRYDGNGPNQLVVRCDPVHALKYRPNHSMGGGAASCGSVCVGGEGPACRERL